MNTSWCKRVTAMGVAVFVFESTLIAAVEPPSMPFTSGETLTYKLSWGIFNVGRAVLQVKGPVEMKEISTYQFVFTIRTNGFADALYKMRDEYVGYADMGMNRSVYFTKKEHHNRKRREVEVNFDWEAKRAHYIHLGKTHEVSILSEGAYDPLSAVFAARLQPLLLGQEMKMPIIDGKRYGDVAIKVVKKQKIKTKAGTFDALLVQPELKNISKVFKKRKKAYLKFWMSDDAYKLPVKIVSKVKWGSFRAELLSVERPEPMATLP